MLCDKFFDSKDRQGILTILSGLRAGLYQHPALLVLAKADDLRAVMVTLKITVGYNFSIFLTLSEIKFPWRLAVSDEQLTA